jgi:hypothetical protein
LVLGSSPSAFTCALRALFAADELHIPATLFTPSAVRILFASYPFTAVKFIGRPGVEFLDRPNDEALSQAAVNFGRALAGHPPLTWTPV